MKLDDRKVIGTGAIGSVIAAICCFTPVLAVLFGVLGLSALLGWADYILLPSLAVFLAITVCGLLLRRRRKEKDRCSADHVSAPERSS